MCFALRKHAGRHAYKPALQVTNEFAERMEALSDEEIVSRAMGVLRTMFGKKRVPKWPANFLVPFPSNPIHVHVPLISSKIGNLFFCFLGFF